MGHAYKESGTTFFFITIAISAIGATGFGWALGFTSPILVENKPATDAPGLLCPTYSENGVLMFPNGTFVPDCTTNANYSFIHTNGKPCPAHTTAYPRKDITDNAHKMNCELQMSQSLQYWFGSIVNLGCLIGALGGGSVADALGKKKAMVLMQALFAAGWLCLFLIPDPKDGKWTYTSKGEEVIPSNAGIISAMLFTGRIILGIAVGISCCTIAAYQTEICPTAIRGAIGTIFQIGIVTGLFTSYLVGSIVSWRILTLIPLIVSGVGLVLTFFLKESPVWLLSKGRDKEARNALKAYRKGATAEDLEFMLDNMRTSDDGDTKSGGLRELFGDRVNRKTLFIGIGLMFVQQLSGINAIMFYSGTILQTVAGTSAQANEYSVGMQGMQVAVTFMSAFFMDRAGRVPILIFAASGMVVSSYALAYFYIFTNGGPKILALVAFYGYVFFFGCGMGAIPWSIMGEIFNPSVKGLASSFATAVNWTFSFVITFTLGTMTDGFQDIFVAKHPDWAKVHPHGGMGVVFFIYGSIALVGIVFIKAVIPETKGKTMAQIQAELRGEKVASSYPSIQ